MRHHFIEDQRLQILQFGLTVLNVRSRLLSVDRDESDDPIVIKIVKVFKIFVLDLRAYSTYGPNMHFLDGEQIFHLEDFQFFRMHYFRVQIRFYCML